jgi:hypothetical protein
VVAVVAVQKILLAEEEAVLVDLEQQQDFP